MSNDLNHYDKIKSLNNIFNYKDCIGLDNHNHELKYLNYARENVLFNCVFIVRDLKVITSNLEGANTGSQKNRGQVDSMTRRLSYIDNDLIKSMSRHTLIHRRADIFESHHFTCKNLHMNLGFSRY